MATTLHVVSHTHWDREWYLPHEVFRLRLVRLIDKLLHILDTDPTFRHFSLDAQTIVLEDYLEIRPHEREHLVKYIQKGRIAVGPWYQLNDEFLVSGEATVRSLLVGHRIAAQFGGVMKVGYLPDQFGNISQMPQILKGFGIDNAIMGRGRQLSGDQKMEFWWEAPDGSRVLASLMALWYNNAQYLPEDPQEAVSFLTRVKDAMSRFSASEHLLLMNGVDHLEPLPWVGKTLSVVADQMRRQQDTEVLHSTLMDYVSALRDEVQTERPALETVVGELRQDRGGACLAGTLSTRVYLKQANANAQNALERYAEPLSAFAHICGKPYPHDELTYAWKLLMQNHPHDSICGCSVDQVHDEMMPRFQRVQQVAEYCTQEALDALAGRDRTKGAVGLPCALYVFNTLNWPRTDPVEAVIEVPLGPPARGNAQRSQDAVLRGLRIVGPNGETVPYELRGNETVLNTVTNPVDLPMDQWVQRLTVAFVARDVPPCGYSVYRLEAADRWQGENGRPLAVGGDPPLLTLEDVGDVGDEYLHRPPIRDLRVQLDLWAAPQWASRQTPVRAMRVVRTQLELPRCSTPSARADETVACPVEVVCTTWEGVPRQDVHITVENRAMDHRLRLLVDASGRTVWAASPYDVVMRPARPEEEAEGASPFHPFTLWLAAQRCDRPGTVMLAAPGLYEYEAYTNATGDIEAVGITLLRCVGQLSGRGDGPGIATAGAQCPGRHSFDIAIYETSEDWEAGQVWRQAYQFAAPLLAVQAPIPGDCSVRSFLTVEPWELVVTAVKRCEDRENVVVRLFNTTHSVVGDGRVQLVGAKSWRRVNLNEEPQGDWCAGGEANLEVRSREIVTLEFAA